MTTHTIVWYRDFYDVPRMFCVAVAGRCLLFDCRFDDAHDAYSDRYAVTFVPLPPDDADAVIRAAAASAPQRRVAVADLHFDPLRRASVAVQ